MGTAAKGFTVKFPSNFIYCGCDIRQEATYAKTSYHYWKRLDNFVIQMNVSPFFIAVTYCSHKFLGKGAAVQKSFYDQSWICLLEVFLNVNFLHYMPRISFIFSATFFPCFFLSLFGEWGDSTLDLRMSNTDKNAEEYVANIKLLDFSHNLALGISING